MQVVDATGLRHQGLPTRAPGEGTAVLDFHRSASSRSHFFQSWPGLAQVHDELVYEVRSDLLPEMRKVVRRCMEGAVKLQVPLRVNLKEGANWGQMAPVEE